MVKGFKDSSGKFHPITDGKGVRKSRDQSTKSQGVLLRKKKTGFTKKSILQNTSEKEMSGLIEDFLVRLSEKEGTEIGTTTRDEIVKEMLGTKRKAREKITRGFVKKTESLRLGSDSEEQIMVLQSAGTIAGETIGLGRKVDDEITKQFIIEMGDNYLTKINSIIEEIEARQGDQLFDSDITPALATGDRFLYQMANTVKKIDPVIKSSIERRIVTSQKELRKVKTALWDVAING